MRKFSLILVLIWALWWLYFGLASGDRSGIADNLISAIPGIIFAASVYIAWRWQKVGRVILLVEGLIILFGYPRIAEGELPFITILIVLMLLALPPLLSGSLLIISNKKPRAPETPPQPKKEVTEK
ncbi:MAG: hypothetical protein COY66_03250 [Candidatus Kerfeldbacteria bacterium CG_4_10_14_0_8_um_filter_42_10]|uniref:DUF7670 domain-containing protein n=1 Tax=Candidatus Kerfeldbacteria bacterium CG_4_10_14_0_8_um_filter_42_10 TaxID=2014248 RepID=A0A2M7RJH4_9BACT|nr:MAG: hypothetical protein COY66_03250 [Candidatus Kerfeldbacteria bacterium CG_4_10_14_0_8_um_filter_42_10]